MKMGRAAAISVVLFAHHDDVHRDPDAHVRPRRTDTCDDDARSRRSALAKVSIRPVLRRRAGAAHLPGFCCPILWMTTTSFQAGEKMFQLDDRVDTVGMAPGELSQRAVPRAPFRTISSTAASCLAVRDDRQRRVRRHGRLWPGEVPIPRRRGWVLLLILSTLMLPLEVTLVPTFLVDPQVRLDQHLSGPGRTAAHRGVRRFPDAPVDHVDPHRLYRGGAHRRRRARCASSCR